MKKLLLSFSLAACMFTAQAQNNVGTGMLDDFNSVTEYGTAAGGIFWWEDAANPNDYALARTGTALTITVNKDVAYSPFGFGFGDANGDGTGAPHFIDISGMKQLTLKGSATADVRVDVQLEDVNGVKMEIAAPSYDKPNGEKSKLGFDLTSTTSDITVDLAGARVVDAWTCTNWPTDCPSINTAATAAFDWTKVSKVMFFVSGGTAYVGDLTFDDVTLGAAPSTPPFTLSSANKAAANIASSVIYPNPATDRATVKMNLKSSSDVKVTVSDMMGREVAVVAEGSMTSLEKSFDVSTFTKGLYTVNYFINGSPAKAELLMVK